MITKPLYGKFNSEFSCFYDPMMTCKTTITGQLVLSMLVEELTLQIPECQWIGMNTDGVTIRIPRDKQQLYYKICKNWEKISMLELEYVEYEKYISRDINNYMAIYAGGGVKYKGVFEINKELHKDPSAKIVAKAVSEYYINNTPVEQTIKSCKDIYDFCLRLKTKNDAHGVLHYLDDNGDRKVTHYGKITRFVPAIGKTAGMLKKYYNSGKVESVGKGFSVKVINDIIPEEIDSIKINYTYYIAEANDLIRSVYNGQLTLF